MKKQTLSYLLALCLVCALLTVTALAAEQDASVLNINGSNYTISSDGTVTIDGAAAELPEGISYDYATNTLTLDGAELTQLTLDYAGTDDDGNAWQHLPNADLTIELKGENSIINPAEGVNNVHIAFLIEDGVNATIQGKGSINLISEGESEAGEGLWLEDSKLCLKSGKVNIASDHWYAMELGYSELILSGGSMNVSTTSSEQSAALYLYESTMTVTGGTHMIGDAEKTAVLGIWDIESEINFEGGRVICYGSEGAIKYLYITGMLQPVEDILSSGGQLTCGISIANDMVVTDVETGEELTMGIHTERFSYYYSITADGSDTINEDWSNCATAIVVEPKGSFITIDSGNVDLDDALVLAATYDDNGKLTSVLSSEMEGDTVTFPEKLSEGTKLFFLDAATNAPLYQSIVLDADDL